MGMEWLTSKGMDTVTIMHKDATLYWIYCVSKYKIIFLVRKI
jgi:hypothetical protein